MSSRCWITLVCLAAFFAFITMPSRAHAQCSDPDRPAGARNYFTADSIYKLCDGTEWVPFHVSDTLPGSCTLEAQMDFDAGENAYKYCTSGAWKKIACTDDEAGGGGNCTNAVSFDNSNALWGEDLDMTDGPSFTVSFWFRFEPSGPSAVQVIFSNNMGRVQAGVYEGSSDGAAGSYLLWMNAKNSSGTNLSNDASSGYILQPDEWYHVLFSINTSTGAINFYINDVDTGPPSASAGTIDIANEWFDFNDSSNSFTGDIAEFWFQDNLYLDFSQTSNRRKFISSSGYPVPLGDSGEMPTGSPAAVFMSGPTSDWHNNKGTAGGFSPQGTLTTAATSPSDGIPGGCEGGDGGSSCAVLPGQIEYKSKATHSTNLNQPSVVKLSPDGNLAYVVGWGGLRLSIYDISGSPAAPTFVGRIDSLSNFWEVSALELNGNYAFAVARGNNSLNVFDISNPASPSRIATIRSSPTNQMNNLWGMDLTDDGNYAVTVSWGSGGGSNNKCFLHVIDITTPSSPSIVGTLDVTAASGAGWQYCEKVQVRNGTAFLAMTDGGLISIDVSTPSSPTYLDRVAHADAWRASRIVISHDGNYAFVTTWSSSGGSHGAFHTFDISDPSNLAHAAVITHSSFRVSYGIGIYGDYVLVGADSLPAFAVVDVSDPLNPTYVDHISDSTNLNEPGSAAIHGQYAYVPAFANNALSVVDLGCNLTPGGGGAGGGGGGGSAPTAGLIGHWEFDESSGTTAAATVSGLNATLYNGPQWQPSGGVIEGALQFTGSSNQHARTGNTWAFDPDPDKVLSIAFWFKRSSMPINPWEYILFNEADCTGWTFDIDDGELWFTVATSNNRCVSGSNYYSAIANDTRYDDGQWHHAVGIVDRPAGQMRLYINGVLKGTNSSINTRAGNPGYSAPFRMGANWADTYNYDGMIDDLRIYDRALTLQEIQDLYGYSGEPEPGPSCCLSLGSCSSLGTVDYFTDEKVLAYCDGAEWLPMAGESCGP